jgi:hypothetical protein
MAFQFKELSIQLIEVLGPAPPRRGSTPPTTITSYQAFRLHLAMYSSLLQFWLRMGNPTPTGAATCARSPAADRC